MLLDINTASEQELERLPGIGPATAKKIVGGRPYRSEDELVRIKIVSKSTYSKIKAGGFGTDHGKALARLADSSI